MAKFNLDDVILDVGDGKDKGEIVVENQTDEEWNTHQNNLGQAVATGKEGTAIEVALFDEKVKSLKNIVVTKDGEDIEITTDNISLIPDKEKIRLIRRAYAPILEISRKN